MLVPGLRLGLSQAEIEAARRLLVREPNETEWAIIDAEWSEHSSYKSSRRLLRLFPTKGKRVVLGPGYDAGAVDVGDGYVVTLHIESHNHPSAIDPYGGASTGIGGVLRDILSMGSRPVALVDMLRFGDVVASSHSKWLFRNVVRGIADYGNCVGVPTVAGDIEFDESFERNCLVDVGCVGIGRKGSLILGEARRPGDILVLVGGSTGRDGMGGATFASKNLGKGTDSERSSVQVPDPFMKKLLIDALLEAAGTKLIRGMKDLGGGGLSTALSEVASKGGTGIDVELGRVRVREADMNPTEIMTSESQERMLLVLGPTGSEPVLRILEKYEVPYALLGRVTDDGMMKVRWKGRLVADLPAKLVANAPLVHHSSRRSPRVRNPVSKAAPLPDAGDSLLRLLSCINISSRRWVYEQYDHEVGVRTVLKPGYGDASLLRLPNGSMLAIKADGNSKHAFLNPRRGAAGCVAEACRNVVVVGAEPVAMVDHLQFGDPSDPEVYWTFKESVRGMADYCKALGLPVVGGKVSFYNEDSATKRAIKPTPIALVVGLATATERPGGAYFRGGEWVFLVGSTEPELGGSEYYERLLKRSEGIVPRARPLADSRTYRTVLDVVDAGLVEGLHDCSKGGLGVALAEMCIPSAVGADLDLSRVPGYWPNPPEVLFSESHGRFIISTRKKAQVESILSGSGVSYSLLGRTGGGVLHLSNGTRDVCRLDVGALKEAWEPPLDRLMD